MQVHIQHISAAGLLEEYPLSVTRDDAAVFVMVYDLDKVQPHPQAHEREGKDDDGRAAAQCGATRRSGRSAAVAAAMGRLSRAW